MLVLCFCQKLSGLIRWAVWIALGKYSWRTLRIGFTVDQADPDPPRISIMTVNPRSRTSSLKKENHDIIIIHIIYLSRRRIFSKPNHIIVSNSYSLMKLYYQYEYKCSLYRTIRECADTHEENISKIPHQSKNVKRYNLLIIYVSFFKIYQYKV